MKKYLIPLLIITVIGLSALFAVRFLLGGDEDTWICQNGSWVKHGNPNKPMPETGCGNQGKTTNTGGERYEFYRADDFEVKYPYWQNVEKKNLLEPEKTKLAVTDGRCNFVITSIPVPSDTTFKEHTQKLIGDQLIQSKYPVKIITSDIQDINAHIEGEFTLNKTDLHSISYGYMTSKRQSYGIAFIAEKSLFDSTCRPIINDVVASVKVK